jgi:NADPH:quinone reductase-like Zn-dependent oxidoreductase
VHVRFLIVPQNRADLLAVTEVVLSGEIRPVIDRVFPIEETAEAMRYVADGLARGKVVISVNN